MFVKTVYLDERKFIDIGFAELQTKGRQSTVSYRCFIFTESKRIYLHPQKVF